ncbi:quaternary amine ABC transporter ATP-binding protein [Georgenia satyanarayanai]|uniref:quaternary amine ABC transporter ATP-binding protein n=1 Tax=Georgenia satyanarayanai TaxID=860221 RepID=UPI003F7A65AE
MSVSALRAENVYKVFGRRSQEAVRRLRAGASRDEVKPMGTAAVIDASFEVQPGETFVVMGLSGSGKSTLIRMLNGLLTPTAGRVVIGDQSITDVSPAELRQIRRTKISMVFQHFALLPHRTVLDNVAYPQEIRGMAKAERLAKAQEAVAMTGLAGWEDSLPAQLSGGMRQRVGLARALAADTDILLMDEAFSALDPLIRREMQEQLVELQSKLGKTIVFITHDLNEAMFLGDRIAVMRDGRVVQIDTAEQILAQPADDYVAKFIADVDRSRVITAGALMRRPISVVQLGGGPGVALRELEATQGSAAYVVDRRRVLHGTVHDQDLLAAQRRGDRTLESAVRPDTSAVSPDTPLSDMFAPAAEARLPLAVTDADGRLVGVVPRVSMLEAMVPPTADDESPDVTAEQEPAPAPAPAPAPDVTAPGGNEATSAVPVQTSAKGEAR